MRREPEAEGKRWLEQAKEDLKWVKDPAQRGGYYLACFLAQQVGEKTLKAYLYAQGEEIVIGNSVGRLCDTAKRFNPLFQEKAKKWAILDSYHIPTRYPNGLPDDIPARVYNKDAADAACALAEEILTFAETLLEK